MKNIIKRFFKIVFRIHPAHILIWNIPLIMVLFGYTLAYTKLEFLHFTDFKIAFWTDATETAIKLTLWFYRNSWAFTAFAIISNLIYVLIIQIKYYKYFFWGSWSIMLISAIYINNLFFYLNLKIVIHG